MNEATYVATKNWLSTASKGQKAIKNGDWKAAERYFRKALTFSICLDLTTHLYTMLDHAVALRALKRNDEAIQLAQTVHALTMEHLKADQAEFHSLLDLTDLLIDPHPQISAEDFYQGRYEWDGNTPFPD
jgi:hypothetical protein